MNYSNLLRGKWALVTGALFVMSMHGALASDAPTISGSYQVMRSRNLGALSQIEVRIRLVNHEASDFYVQRMTLWDFSHADKGGTKVSAIALHSHGLAETIQQFTIRRSDFQLWQKGFRPRLVLQMAGPGRTKSKAVVRLDRISNQEAK
jgi:hypothetical protein